MLKSDELTLKLSEHRQAHNDLVTGGAAEDTDEARAAHDEAIGASFTKTGELEAEFRAAKTAESEAVEQAHELRLADIRSPGGGDMASVPPEIREMMGIESRCSIDGFTDGIDDTLEVTGAERELRASMNITRRGVIPWGMLLAPTRLQEIRQEQREALAEGAKVRAMVGRELAARIGEGNDTFLRAAFGSGSSIMSMQDPIIQDVFGASTAAFLMTRFASAPVGDALELVLTSTGAGITADRTARTAAGSLAARTLTPKAIRAVYDINGTDLQRFRGMESGLRADLPRAITDVMDKNVLIGGNFSGSILARTVAPTTATAVPTFGGAIGLVAAGIDGKHARTLKELKVVVNPTTMAQFYGLLASNTAVTLPDYFMMNSGGIMCTSNMPVKATNVSRGIVCKTGPGVQFNGIARLWGGGVQVIRDEYSKAPENQLIITANLYADYDVVRVAGYAEISTFE